MKQVNIDIKQMVLMVAIQKLSRKDYITELTKHKGNATKVFLKKYKNSRFKNVINKDNRGKDITVTETFMDILKKEYNISRATAMQAILNMERNK